MNICIYIKKFKKVKNTNLHVQFAVLFFNGETSLPIEFPFIKISALRHNLYTK